MKRKLIHLVLAALVAGAAMAQEVSIRSDHPDEYVVVKGDTLWDIAGKFLDHPWQWPAIWYANQQIENPHLIYPGDVLSLMYLDGQPRLMVDRGKPTVRLSPEARVTTRSPVPPIPHEAIEGFIRNMRLVGADRYDGLPYVISNEERRLLAAELDNTYVRGLDAEVGEFVSIMRRGSIYFRKGDEIRRAVEPGYGQHAPTRIEHHPTAWESAANFGGNRGDIVGYELYEVAEAMVVKTGDISILKLGGGSDIEVMEGDVIMPVDDIGYVDQYMPRAMEAVPEGLHILAVQGDNRLVGTYKMVSINGGARQGIEPGHVFSAFRPGDRIRDRVKYPAGSLADAAEWREDFVTLPDEFGGHIMVFRVFDEISYALVMAADRPVREFDLLKHPDETL